jgi:hypothetical protein
MFKKLIEKLMFILQSIENDVSPEIVLELKDIINSIGNSKCSNDMFCGMDKKW